MDKPLCLEAAETGEAVGHDQNLEVSSFARARMSDMLMTVVDDLEVNG